jgi:hypothetical protein
LEAGQVVLEEVPLERKELQIELEACEFKSADLIGHDARAQSIV